MNYSATLKGDPWSLTHQDRLVMALLLESGHFSMYRIAKIIECSAQTVKYHRDKWLLP